MKVTGDTRNWAGILKFIRNTTRQCAQAQPGRLKCWALAALLATGLGTHARGQSPGILWLTNVNAQVFAIDAQTNIYATSNGTVMTINAAGSLVQTRNVCPRPGIAQRDAAGNLYLAGNFSGTQDFGGTTLISPQQLFPPFQFVPAGYLAKYNASGILQWAVEIEPNVDLSVLRNQAVGDLQVDPGGAVYVGYSWGVGTSTGNSEIDQYSTGGTKIWGAQADFQPVPGTSDSGTVRLGVISPTNASMIFYKYISDPNNLPGAWFKADSSGASQVAASIHYYGTFPGATLGRPVGNAAGEMYVVSYNTVAKLSSSGTQLWSLVLGGSGLATVAPEAWGGVHVATADGTLARIDIYGHLTWSMPLPAACNGMVGDAAGNIFVSMSDGNVMRLQAESAPPVQVVPPRHNLTTMPAAAGSIGLNPPGGNYASTNIVTATATPNSGWSFLYWLGDAAGTNPVVNILMDHDKTIGAVYGTTLATTAAGSGQVLVDPPSGPYPYGSIVRLTAVPQTGNYFDFWSGAASGSVNPLYYTVSDSGKTVSSVFIATPAGQVTLTTLITGKGRVNANPAANTYSLNQSVTLTAAPDPGQTFLSWSGDASGTQNPLTVSMTTNKTVTANFSSRPLVRTDRPGVEGPQPTGFHFTVSGALQTYQVLASTDLSTWTNVGSVTNVSGEVQFTDPGMSNIPARYYRVKQ